MSSATPRKLEATATAFEGVSQAETCDQHRNSLALGFQLDGGLYGSKQSGSYYPVLPLDSPVSLPDAISSFTPGPAATTAPTVFVTTPVHVQQFAAPVDHRVYPHMLQRDPVAPAAPYGPSDPQSLGRGDDPAVYQRSWSVDWAARGVVDESRAFPRQRSAKACTICRKRKTRCSGEPPCERCIERGLECVFDDTPTLRGRRGPARAASHDKGPTRKASLDASAASHLSHTGDQEPSQGGLNQMNGLPAVTHSAAGMLDSPEVVDRDILQGAIPDEVAAPDSPMTPASEPAYPQFARGSLTDSPTTPQSPSVHGYFTSEERGSTSNHPWTGVPYSYMGYNHPSAVSRLSPDVPSISSSASSSPATWPTPLDHGPGRAAPPIPPPSFSSSSLKDALTPRPRRASMLQPSARFPHPVPPDSARALSSMLRHTSIADAAGTTAHGTLPVGPPSDAPHFVDPRGFERGGS